MYKTYLKMKFEIKNHLYNNEINNTIYIYQYIFFTKASLCPWTYKFNPPY